MKISKFKKRRSVRIVSILFCFVLFFKIAKAQDQPLGDEITGGFKFASPAFEKEGRWKVEGDKAKFISSEIIEVSPVRAVVYGNGSPDILIRMDRAQINRSTKDVWSDAVATGMQWDTAKKVVTLLKDVKMKIDVEEAKQWQNQEV